MGKMNINFDFLVNLFNNNQKAHHEYHTDVVYDYIDQIDDPVRAEKMRKYHQMIVGEMNNCESTDERNTKMNNMFWKQTQVFTEAFDSLNRILK